MQQQTSAAAPPALLAELKGYVGRRYGAVLAWDPVNAPMVRQWCEAIGMPASDFMARGIAPASMLPVWLMPGLDNARPEGSDLSDNREVFGPLEREGYAGILGVSCEQEYERPLRIGERISCSYGVETISDEKQTAVGRGFFVTFLQEFRDEAGQPVGTMRLRILRYRPKPTAAADAPRRPAPPQPVLSPDTAFFWEGLKAGKLLIQRCTACRTLRHPPGPACEKCQCLDWDTVQASGRGTLFSFVVMHKPVHPAWDAPHPVGLIALEEGVRMVAPMHGTPPGSLKLGMAVEAAIETVESEHRLPRFRPAGGA